MAKDWAKPFYNSGIWRTTRGIVLRRDHYTCADCYGRAEEVHHEIELTPDNIHDHAVSLNIDLLISLCHVCHTKRTGGSVGDIGDGYEFDEHGIPVQRTPPRK